MKFTDLNLQQCIIDGINELRFETCTPVQSETLKLTIENKDVHVQSQTGTGKTAAYLITIFYHFINSKNKKSKSALVLVPTRELAIQVEKDANQLAKYCDVKIGSFFGGVGYHKQEKLLKDGLDVYIGTPGRLIDFYKSRKIDFKKFHIMVIDEADRMFDMGFIPDIRYILKKMVPAKERLTMLFSATLNYKVKQLAWEHMNEPAEIEIEPEKITVDTINQYLYHVGKDEKTSLLLGILQHEKPDGALIFTNSRRMTELLSRKLKVNGIENSYISGELPQKQRMKIIDEIKKGKINILIATDVAARGLHIEDLQLVVNYDIPEDYYNYVHRIGRTARAGKSGKAISLVCEEYVYNLEAIEKHLGHKIETLWADEKMYIEVKRAPNREKRSSYSRNSQATGKRDIKKRIQKKKSNHSPGTETRQSGQKDKSESKKKKTQDYRKKPVSMEKKPGSDSGISERLDFYQKNTGKNLPLIIQKLLYRVRPD